MELKKSVVLITGGSQGIGKATAKALLDAGAKVAITARDQSRLKSAAEELGAFPIHADVSDPQDIERTFKELLGEFGRLDCLINNAGTGTPKTLLSLTPEDFERLWRTNVLGAALMAQRAAQLFVTQNHGTIVNIASTAGLKGYEGGTMYVATKFALRGMGECWRAELRRHNVRVITVNPSEVPTAFGRPDRKERPEEAKKLSVREIAHVIKSALEMDDRGFIPEVTVFATNPF